ncbi:T9SS type A sorting domain-containing protein [uncultured Lutibacter sp.]|uniref:T9SS type A sorting domain-containing protein n=1 Tax=uncultured Lutibacter sp. TaxID=437739 RepID=UPI00262BC64B|nr:T9SS type A sorting domain-containing protein [uncultured Lutibacter sp.]
MKQKYLTFLCFYLIFNIAIFSQIVNEGTLQIEPSTTVYFGDEYTNKSAATHNNDGDLYLNNNFINNGITTSVSGTTSFKSSVNAIQTISGTANTANFYNLEVDNTLMGVSITDSFGLFVENAVSLTAGDLRLVGEAQLIQVNNIPNSGSGKLLRDQQGVSTTTAYNFWSSPVNNSGTFSLNGGLFDGTDAIINSFTPQQVLFNSGSPYNGVPATVVGGNVTTPLTISTQWLYTNPAASGWNSINQSTGLAPGEGYIMKGTGAANQNFVFKGTPNNGNYSFTIASAQSLLIGNPYPSALDSWQFITDNLGVFDQIEFWVDGGSPSHYTADYLGGYAIRNLTTGVAPSVISSIDGLGGASGTIPERHIAVGQSFIVEATGAGTSIVFNNAQRTFITEGSGASVFYKNSSSKITKEVNSFIRIGYEDPEGFHRQLALGFLPNSPADMKYNRGYDAIMSGPREDELFYIIENDLTKKYVIQGVGAFEDAVEFPLGLIIEEEGVHTIMLDAVENFDKNVYLKDVVLDTIYNLSTANFIPNLPTGEYLDRFKLVFKPKEEMLVVDDVVLEKTINVYYNKNNSIIINKPSELKLNNVLIFNMLGQQLVKVTANLLSESQISIPFQFKKGMYLVLIESEEGKKTYKIVN